MALVEEIGNTKLFLLTYFDVYPIYINHIYLKIVISCSTVARRVSLPIEETCHDMIFFNSGTLCMFPLLTLFLKNSHNQKSKGFMLGE